MNFERISPSDAKSRMDDGYTYLDVRSTQEFEAGHPEGSFNVPLMHKGPAGMQPNADFMIVMEKNFPKDAQIVVGCQGGNRSVRAADQLLQGGWTQILEQRAGFGGARDPATGALTEAGWAEAGLPVSTTPGEGATYTELHAKAGLE